MWSFLLHFAVHKTKLQKYTSGRGNDEMRTTSDFTSANIEAYRVKLINGHRRAFGQFLWSEINKHGQKSSALVNWMFYPFLFFFLAMKNCASYKYFVSVKITRQKVCYISTISCSCSTSMKQWTYFCWWLHQITKLYNDFVNILGGMKAF